MFKNVRIRTRLFIGFAILLGLFIFLSIFTLIEMQNIIQNTTELFEHPFRVCNAIRETETAIVNMQRIMREVLLVQNTRYFNSQHFNNYVTEVNEYENKALQGFDVALKYVTLVEKSLIVQLREEFLEWKPIPDSIFEALRKNEKEKAFDIVFSSGRPHADKLMQGLKRFREVHSREAEQFYVDSKRRQSNTLLISIILDMVAVVLASLIAYSITLSITRPIGMAVNISNRLAEGDIAFEFPEYSKDEMGNMLKSMKNMAEKLRFQMQDIAEGVHVLASSAAEISATTAQFASTTQEVAASINEVFISMKEVKETAALSNEKAREVSERARSAVEISRSGEAAVHQTMEVINSIQEQMISIADSVVELSDQSQSISQIITAVDDLSDQSRLLAVNAAIEAVKAGEQGKGFSVVADEIKNLAEQSKESTAQVRSILTDIQKATSAAVMTTEKGSKAVENGVRQANQTGSAIRALGAGIEQASNSALQIEATSRQQSAGVEQIFSAMENINAAVSQNAQSARQLENSAQVINELGRKLKNIVDKYKV
ncbi:MAG: methyl-accepting chemotaxis protein [Candidatus Omnitrophota bacterium]